METLHLLHRAGQAADAIAIKHLEPFDLTLRQYACMKAVQDGAENQTDVVYKTGIDRSTIADIMRRLVEQGLVYRERSERDARALRPRSDA